MKSQILQFFKKIKLLRKSRILQYLIFQNKLNTCVNFSVLNFDMPINTLIFLVEYMNWRHKEFISFLEDRIIINLAFIAVYMDNWKQEKQ